MSETLIWLRRLADVVGMMAFFPLLMLISYATNLVGLVLALHLYFVLTTALAAAFLWKVRWPDPKKSLISSAIMGISAVLMALALAPIPLAGTLSNLGTVASMLVIGLYAHDVAKVSGLRKLDRFGGLIVLGSFLVVIRESFVVLIAMLLLSLGLGGVSQYLRVALALARRREG